MFWYGVIGFLVGFIVGLAVNMWLLKGVPHDQRLNDPKIRTRYGLLNWAIALFGMMIALAIYDL